MRVIVDLDPRDVWRIQEQAERQGVLPGDVLRRDLDKMRRRLDVTRRVKDMTERGFCDADIAERLGYTVGRIAEIRRGLSLPANRRYRSSSERKTA
jgi:hypothetical protein